MTKTVALIGSFDTKGSEFAFVRDLLKNKGVSALMVDFGVMGEPPFETDVTRNQVIQAGGGDMQRLQSGEHKDEAMKVVTRGVARIVEDLFSRGEIQGVMGMGGSGGTSVVTAALRTLPVGVPKVMVSTVGGGDVSAYAGTRDIVFVPSVVDVAGLNRVSRRIFANAAGALAGMMAMDNIDQGNLKDRPLIAASMFGNTTTAVSAASQVLEDSGFETLVFHCTGIGGRTMESLVADRQVEGVLDITTTELADFVCGGVFDAGASRCLAAARTGIPAVLVPGCVDMANFGAADTVPQQYRNRLLYEWNANVTLLRTGEEENKRIGEMIAAAANESTAGCSILLPLRGVSMLDSEGGRFWDPAADEACFDAIRANVRDDIPVIELDYNINDPEFSTAVANELLRLLHARS